MARDFRPLMSAMKPTPQLSFSMAGSKRPAGSGQAGRTGSGSDPGGNDPGERFVEYAALSRAQVQVEFNRPGAPENDDLDADTDPHSEEQED